MTQHTLFGEMTLRFSAHPENVATEALTYLLVQHERAWPTLRTHLLSTGMEAPEELAFRSQAALPDLAQPDIVATDSHGNRVLVIEVKYWAGLTENQPVAYLQALAPDRPAILLFVCPAQRPDTL